MVPMHVQKVCVGQALNSIARIAEAELRGSDIMEWQRPTQKQFKDRELGRLIKVAKGTLQARRLQQAVRSTPETRPRAWPAHRTQSALCERERQCLPRG